MTKLLDSARGADPIAVRDRALLEVMYGCGLRASEAIGLEIGDVDLRHGFVRPHGKGSKDRVVPLGSQAARRDRPLPARRAARADRSPGAREQLFVNFRGGSLSRQGLYKIIQRHAQARSVWRRR